jgi:hypothetical protein
MFKQERRTLSASATGTGRAGSGPGLRNRLIAAVHTNTHLPDPSAKRNQPNTADLCQYFGNNCYGGECYYGYCDPATGNCDYSSYGDGTPCSIGVCYSGTCTGGGKAGAVPTSLPARQTLGV